MCGEKPQDYTGHRLASGSPPHVRGKVGYRLLPFLAGGITPACAGKRCCGLGRFRRWQDHPRMCGEKIFTSSSKPERKGSPPHVRGKVLLRRRSQHHLGITPACAGKSVGVLSGLDAARDHPRMCGEKCRCTFGSGCCQGSPPHVRGKDERWRLCDQRSGITPACAGKRLKRSRSTVPPAAIVPPFPSVCNKLVVSDGSLAERDAPLFLPAENTAPASPTYNLRSL